MRCIWIIVFKICAEIPRDHIEVISNRNKIALLEVFLESFSRIGSILSVSDAEWLISDDPEIENRSSPGCRTTAKERPLAQGWVLCFYYAYIR